MFCLVNEGSCRLTDTSTGARRTHAESHHASPRTCWMLVYERRREVLQWLTNEGGCAGTKAWRQQRPSCWNADARSEGMGFAVGHGDR